VRRVFGAVLIAVLVTGPSALAQAPTPTATPGPAPITAGAAILVALSDNDRVLFSRDEHASLAPASLTKVVTALVARDQYDVDEVITTTPRVLEPYGSDLGLAPGMKLTVSDLLYGLLLESGNDAAAALAEHHPAGYDHFVRLMNEKARALGAFDSNFRNPHGLDDIGHVSSAWDMAIFSRSLLADPVLAAIVDTDYHDIPWKDGKTLTLNNHHKLIDEQPEAIGIKTGFTNQAGHCLITAWRTSAGTFVSVVMKSQDQYGDSRSLLERGRSFQLSAAAGGGSSGPTLSAPPQAGALGLLPVPGGKWDPRDEEWWGFLMIGLALAAIATIGIRRRDPLLRAADVHPWLDNFVGGHPGASEYIVGHPRTPEVAPSAGMRRGKAPGGA